MSKRLDYMLSAALAIGVTVAIVPYLFYSHQQAIKQEKAIAAFSATIAVGMPKNEAIRACEAAAEKHRGWRYKYWPTNENEGGLPEAVVESPLTFGAGNWVVWILFDGDVVAAVLVRTPDSNRFRPEAAPQDRVDDPKRPQLAGFAPES
jgi:hypothetical protein